MPEETKPEAKSEGSGGNAEIKGMLEQVLALLSQLAEGPGALSGAGTEGGKTGSGSPISDEELAQLLGLPPGGQGDAPRNDEKPVQNSAGYAGGDNTHVAKLEKENTDLRVQLSRSVITKSLHDARLAGKDINPDDAELVKSLSSLPPDVRDFQLGYLIKNARTLPVNAPSNLNAALLNSVTGLPQGTDEATKQAAVKLARKDDITYEMALEKLTGKTPHTTSR